MIHWPNWSGTHLLTPHFKPQLGRSRQEIQVMFLNKRVENTKRPMESGQTKPHAARRPVEQAASTICYRQMNSGSFLLIVPSSYKLLMAADT